MIVSLTVYYIFIATFILLCLLPGLYTGFVAKKKDSPAPAFGFLILLTLPINWYTPTILTVTDCNQYKKEVMLLPTDGYAMGKYNYIVNKSANNLLLQHHVYGRVDNSDVQNDVIIKAGETHQAPFVHLDYIFEPAPDSVKTKGDGDVKTELTCYVGDTEE